MAGIQTSLTVSVSPKKLGASKFSNSRSKLKLIIVIANVFVNLAGLDLVNCKLNNRLEEHYYDQDLPALDPYSRFINKTPHRSLEIVILNFYHFKSITHSVLSVLAEDDTGDILEIPTDTGMVSVECSSHEPVTWDLEGYLPDPDVIRSVVLKRISSHLQNEASYLYKAVIHIDASSKTNFGGSGNYICSHLNSPTRSTSKSLYLYGRSDLAKTLLQPIDSQNLEIIPVSPIEVVLPCRASHPNVSVQLMKQNHEGLYDTLASNKFNVAYDAKQGFRITVRNVSLGDINSEKELYGLYKCSLSNTKKETNPNNSQLFIKVVNKDISHVKKPKRSRELKINLVEKVGNTDSYNNIQSFHCLSNGSDYGGRSLLMSVVKCNNAVHCKFITKILETRLDQNKINLLQAHETNSLVIPETYMSGIVICTLKKMKYQYVQFYRSVNPYENKIILYPENTNIHWDDKEKDLEATLIDPAATMRLAIFPVSKTVRLKQGTMTIRCTLSSFPLARGSKFLLEYSNGSVVSPHILVQTEKFYTNMMSELEAVVTNRPEDMSNIKCLAPLWNSNKWVNQTFFVSSPKIINTPAKSLTFCEEDTDQNVSCEAEGSPSVTVAWYKDGRPYDDPTQNSQGFYRVFENSVRYTLHFNHVSHVETELHHYPFLFK